MLYQSEKELMQKKKRIREKQKLLIELIKRHVSITKLKTRNIEMQNSLLNGDENGRMNLDKSLAYSNQKLSLPLLFVECQPNSKIKISQDDTKMHLKLTTDRKFALSDENYLFECMGLNRTNEVELRQMFPGKIIEYLNHE